MKKILSLIVMAVAFAAPSQAQIKFGLQAGLNLTSMSVNKSEIESLVKNNSGFFVGPTIKFTVPVVGLSFDAAALYDQRSGKVTVNNSEQTLKQQSIQIPVNVRYGVGLGSIANIFAFAGPQFGFNLGDNDKSFNVGNTVDTVKDWTLKSSNLSANVGIGATLLSHLQLKVNYNIALGKTGEFDYLDTAGQAVTGKLKSNSWQISAAYFF